MHIASIVGETHFMKPNGEKVGIGKCAWYCGNFPDQKKGDITFSFIDYRDQAYFKELQIEETIEKEEEDSIISECSSLQILSSTTHSDSRDTPADWETISSVSNPQLDKMKFD